MDDNTKMVLLSISAFCESGAMADLEANPTIENGVELLVAVQEARRQLAGAEAELVSFLADTLPGGVYNVEGVPGVAAVERKAATKRTAWDNEGVFSELYKFATSEPQADPDTGEVLGEAEAMLSIIKQAARPAWRTTALKSFGLQVDEYCKTEYGPDGVRVHLANK